MSHATFVSRNIYQLFGLYVNNKGLGPFVSILLLLVFLTSSYDL